MKWMHVVAPTAATVMVFVALVLTQDDPLGADLPTIIQASGTIALLGVTASYVVASWRLERLAGASLLHTKAEPRREAVLRIIPALWDLEAYVSDFSFNITEPAFAFSDTEPHGKRTHEARALLSRTRSEFNTFAPRTLAEAHESVWGDVKSFCDAHAVALVATKSLRDQGSVPSKVFLDLHRTRYAELALDFPGLPFDTVEDVVVQDAVDDLRAQLQSVARSCAELLELP